jgi:electron transfer flavoprotein beta subunit
MNREDPSPAKADPTDQEDQRPPEADQEDQGMKIAVCMKLVPDLQQIRIKERAPVLDGVPLKFGTMDLTALEEGVRWKEAHGGDVVVFCVGAPKLKEAVKEALARGGDKAVLVADPAFKGLGSEAVAQILAAAIRKTGGADLVLCGEESTDHGSGEVPARLSELLGFGFASWVRKTESKANAVAVHRDMEEAIEVGELALPAVLGVTSEINQPRIASMVQILRAGKKPVESLGAADLGLKPAEILAPKIKVSSDLAPVLNRKQVKIQGTPDEAVAALKQALQKEGLL